MPGLVREIIRPHITELADRDITVMLNDCDFQERTGLYGHETIDKSGWILWRRLLEEERDRRERKK